MRTRSASGGLPARVLGLVVLVGFLLAVVGSAAIAVPAGPQRYLVVGAPVDGRPDYLFAVAARTLGDGLRYREIFELNEDRPQPDGQALVDPMQVLRPGWILLLPADATGDEVRTGTPPSAAAPSRVAAGHVPRRSGGRTVLWIAVLLGVALAAAAAVDRRRGWPAVWLFARLSAIRRARFSWLLAGWARFGRDRAGETLAGWRARRRPEVSLASWLEVGQPEPDPMPAPTATPEVIPVRPALYLADGTVDVEVDDDSGERLGVRLRPGGGTGAAVWIAPGEPRPGVLPVLLGSCDGWDLCLDLDATPDILTVSGQPHGCRGLAARIAGQLLAAGHRVVTVGDVLGSAAPHGVQRFPTVAAAEDELRGSAPGRVILFTGGLGRAETRVVRRLGVAGERVVPIAVGDVLRARWSIVVDPVDSRIGTPVGAR